MFKDLLRGDKAIWTVYFMLCFISLIELYSASSMIAHKSANYFSPMASHATHLLMGFGVLLVFSNFKYNWFKVIPFIFGPFVLFMLVYLIFWGEKTNDAARSIVLLGFPLQPSELAKVCLIIYISHVLSNYNDEKRETRLVTFFNIVIPVGIFCLFILTENFSTAALIGLVCFMMMIIGRIDWRYLASSVAIAAVLLGTLYLVAPILPDNFVTHRVITWYERIQQAKEPTVIPKTAFEIPDEYHQVYHAKMAIANGGISPVGLLPGNSIERDFLPLAFSDFIFAIIIEETGLLGALVIMSLYLLLLMRAVIIAQKCRKAFPAFLIMGAALMICTQAIVNMAVAVNLIPVTGQPLPLISKGGTSIIVTCAFIGIMLSVSNFAVDEKELNAEFEMDNDQ